MEIGKSMVIPTQMQTERTNDQQPVERKRNLDGNKWLFIPLSPSIRGSFHLPRDNAFHSFRTILHSQ